MFQLIVPVCEHKLYSLFLVLFSDPSLDFANKIPWSFPRSWKKFKIDSTVWNKMFFSIINTGNLIFVIFSDLQRTIAIFRQIYSNQWQSLLSDTLKYISLCQNAAKAHRHHIEVLNCRRNKKKKTIVRIIRDFFLWFKFFIFKL